MSVRAARRLDEKITHIVRLGSPPDFPRNVKIHVVKIDVGADSLSFQFTATGTRDTVRQTASAIATCTVPHDQGK